MQTHIVQGRSVDIEYDIHNSNLTGVCDEEDIAVRLRTEKILVHSALAIMIIMLYGYTASAPHSNFLDTSISGRATPRQGLYTLIGIAVRSEEHTSEFKSHS